MSNVNLALAEAQTRALLATITGAAPADAAPDWSNPTAEEKLSFASDFGMDPAYVDGWPGPPTPNAPGTWQKTIPALGADATDAQKLRYLGMGFTEDGLRANWTAFSLKVARDRCAQVALARTPEEFDAVFPSCGRVPVEVARVLFMGGGAGPQAFFGPLSQAPSIAAASKFCAGTTSSSASGAQGGTPAGPGL